jgi:hypothetical protein
LKLNGSHQLQAYTDDFNILGVRVHTLMENAEALVVASKEFELEVNADKTQYMVLSPYRKVGRKGRGNIASSSLKLWKY